MRANREPGLAPNVKPVPTGPMAEEPAGTIGTAISGILLAFFGLLKVAGVEFADDLPASLNLFITSLLAIPAITGWLTRFFVYSPAGAQKEVNRAATTGSPALRVGENGEWEEYDPDDPNEVPPENWGINRRNDNAGQEQYPPVNGFSTSANPGRRDGRYP